MDLWGKMLHITQSDNKRIKKNVFTKADALLFIYSNFLHGDVYVKFMERVSTYNVLFFNK